MLFDNLEDPAVRKMIISTIVRVLWSNDVRLARKIIYASELANELLEIRLNKVCCKDYVLLEKHFSDTFLEHWNRKVGRLRTKVAQAASPNHRKQLKSKLQSARRMQSLYWKSAARLVLTGLEVDGGDSAGQCIVTSSEGIQGALRDHWGNVYSKFPFDADAARKLLNVYKNSTGRFVWVLLSP